MIYLVIILLLLLLAVNWTISGSLLYPPCVYTSVWLLSLTALAMSGDTFYPVVPEALMVYLTGALAFSLGGLVTLSLRSRALPVAYSPRRVRQARAGLDMALVVVLIGLPFYVRDIMGSFDVFDVRFLAAVRRAGIEEAESSERAFGLLRNLVVLAQFVALAMYYENDATPARRWRCYLAILLAFVYGALTGSKGVAVTLALSLMFLYFIQRGTVRFAALAWVAVLGVSIFSAGLLLVNYIDTDTGSSIEVLALLGRTVQEYWLGGLVAFNRVIDDPQSLEAVQTLTRFFVETANALGGRFEIPSIHADYTPISPVRETNTYTVYFSYFHGLGWFGVITGMPVLGAALTWVYLRAFDRRVMPAVFYAVLMAAAVLSFHAEHFFLGLNFYIKLAVFLYFVYYVVGRLSLRHHRPRTGRLTDA